MFRAFRLKERRMPPALCNKCRSGLQSAGDSWCLGCSSQEISWRLLQRRWNTPGLRAVAEETVLSGARLLNAFANIDSSLVTSAAAERHPATAAKARADKARSRTPVRDERPPLPRTTSRARSIEHPAGDQPDYDRDSSYEEESEEEDRGAGASAPAHPRMSRVKEEEPQSRGSQKPPEPPGPPPDRATYEADHPRSHHRGDGYRKGKRNDEKKRSRKSKKKQKKRGGAKHQRHYREVVNPFKASHRRLPSSRLQLARSLKEGLSRQA